MPSHPVVTRTLEQDADEIKRRREENIRKYRERQQNRAEKNEARRRSIPGALIPPQNQLASVTLKEKPIDKSSSVPDIQFIYDTQAKWMTLLKRTKSKSRVDATTCPV